MILPICSDVATGHGAEPSIRSAPATPRILRLLFFAGTLPSNGTREFTYQFSTMGVPA